MAFDVYAPCPCGSGKKLKFCCLNIAEDIDRITRLIDDNQWRQALHQLEALRKKHSENAWAVTTEALVHLESGESELARELLKNFLDVHPENDYAVMLLAVAELQTLGLDSARRSIHRAFQKGAKSYPGMVSGLAGSMAAVFQSRGQMLAAREHLALALKFAPDHLRQEIFLRLVDFDSTSTIPYLLRSVHPLPALPQEESLAAEVKKALKYAGVGCWDTAGQILASLAGQHSERAELWHAVGLCRAWDGDEPQAALALHRAAETYADRSAAVECEALAQLLDWNNSEARRKIMRQAGTVSSVSRLLTLLDAVPALRRTELPPPTEDEDPADRPQGLYLLVNQPTTSAPGPAELTIDNVPIVTARVIVYDADREANEPATVYIVAREGAPLADAVPLIREAAGDAVTWHDAPEDTGGWDPEESLYLNVEWYFPPGTPLVTRRRLEIERWRHNVFNRWPNLPLRALQGRTPVEAAGDPASHTAVTAAVYVLDSQCLRANYELPVAELLQRLGLEPLPPVTISPDTSLNSFTPLQWLRLRPEHLSDEQLASATNRAILVHHDRFLYDVLKEAAARPSVMERLDASRIFQTLTTLCRSHDRRQEAFQWLHAGRQHAAAQPRAFEEVWSWDLRELLARLEDPSDPELKPLLDKFVNYYTPKLPQLQPYLEQIVAAAGLPSPWTTGILSPGAAASGGLWTPETAAEPAAAGKLWLPGQ